MTADVDRILAERSRRDGRGREAASLAGAVALHVLFIAVALLLPRLTPPPKPLEFVPVTVIPAQALGVHRPAPPRRSSPQAAPPSDANEAPKPEAVPEAPAPPAPKPAPRNEKPEPALPEKTPAKVPTFPEKSEKPLKPTPPAVQTPPAPAAKKPADAGNPGGKATAPSAGGRGNPNSPANATAEGETGDQAGRRGAATGTPLGTTSFGSHISGLDNPDFTYGYYLDRLLSLIDANWTRPSMGSGVRAIISFHIQRDGTLSGLRVSESSGYNSFDLAALRAVQNAAPFPPLPRAYSHDDLGVNLIVY
jgi:TonB family protein